MRFYRVHIATEQNGSSGYDWFTSKRAAIKCAADHKRTSDDATAEVELVDIEPTRAGLLHALEYYASHPDNG